MAYTMTIYQKDVSDGWTLPYVPAGGFEITEDQNADEFGSINADYNIPAVPNARQVSWSGIWPARAVSWANTKSKATPLSFRKWVRTHRQKKKTFHVVVTNNSGTTVISSTFVMTKFSYSPMQNGVNISMEFKEAPKIVKKK